MIRILGIGGIAALLAGCVTTNVDPAPDPYPVGQCDATAAQARLGATATTELGDELQRAAGARTLRWIPPRTAVTMDYRQDRLNVEYNDNMVVTRISCG